MKRLWPNKTKKNIDVMTLTEEKMKEINSKQNLSEIKLGAMPNLGGNKAPGATTVQQQQAPDAGNTSDGRTGGYFHPKVASAVSETDPDRGVNVIKIYVDYIYPQHIPALQKLARGIEKRTQMGVRIYQSSNDGLLIEIDEDALESFKNVVPLVVRALSSLSGQNNGKYNPNSLKTFEEQLIGALDGVPTVEEMQKYKDLISNNWRDMQTKLNDPATRARLRGLGTFYVPDEYSSIDHKLSDRNKANILYQDPNATYVTSIEGWRYFNRVVVDTHNYIMVLIPSHKKVSAADRDAAARSLGYATNDNKKSLKRQGIVGRGREHQFQMTAQKSSDDNVFYYMKKFYDVANTKWEPSLGPDIFNEQEGYVNNLFGLPNDVAKKNKEEVSNRIKAAADAAKPTEQVRTEMMLERLLRALVIACSSVGIDFKRSDNVAEDIGGAIYQLELYRAKNNYRIVKPEECKEFAESIAAAVSVSIGIENAITGNYVNNNSSMTDEQAQGAFSDYLNIISYPVNSNALKDGQQLKFHKLIGESIGGGVGIAKNYQEFVNLLGKLNTRVVPDNNSAEMNEEVSEIEDEVSNETLSEAFFDFLNKIDK